MPSSTPKLSIPYPLPEDAVVDYPALGSSLAAKIEEVAGLVKLWDSVDAGVVLPASSIVTPTIPQTFKHLLLAWRARSGYGSAMDGLCLRFNGLTAAYFSQMVKAAAAAASGLERLGQAYGIQVGDIAAASAATAAYAGAGVAVIPDYAVVSPFYRFVVGLYGATSAATTGGITAGASFGFYGSPIAVSTIELKTLNGASIQPGSRFTLYGVGG